MPKWMVAVTIVFGISAILAMVALGSLHWAENVAEQKQFGYELILSDSWLTHTELSRTHIPYTRTFLSFVR